MHFVLEPLLLFGEGTYALTSVKEMTGTDSFLELDEKIKLCQTRETVEDCLAKDFLKKGLEKCKCTPFRLRNFTKEVNCDHYYKYLSSKSFEETLCNPSGTECYKSVKEDATKCLPPCKGLYADVEKEVLKKKLKDIRKFDKLLENYEAYKRGFVDDIYHPDKILGKLCIFY